MVTRGERYDRPVSHLVDFKEPVLYLPNLYFLDDNGRQLGIRPLLAETADLLIVKKAYQIHPVWSVTTGR